MEEETRFLESLVAEITIRLRCHVTDIDHIARFIDLVVLEGDKDGGTKGSLYT